MHIYTPYFYIIQDTENLKYYVGVRHAFKCSPSDLLQTYLTSSSTVNSIIRKYGTKRFKIVKIKCFKTKQEALLHEWKFLWRVSANVNERFYNLAVPFPPIIEEYPKIIRDILELKSRTKNYPGLGKNWIWNFSQKELNKIKLDLLSDKWESQRKLYDKAETILKYYDRESLLSEIIHLKNITNGFILDKNWHGKSDIGLAIIFIELNNDVNQLRRTKTLNKIEYLSRFNKTELKTEIKELSKKCSYHLESGWSNYNIINLLKLKKKLLSTPYIEEIKDYNSTLREINLYGNKENIISEIEAKMKLINFKLYPKWKEKDIVVLFKKLKEMNRLINDKIEPNIYFKDKLDARNAIMEIKQNSNYKLMWSWQRRNLEDLNLLYKDIINNMNKN
jgi:hypothetical protein